MAHTLDTESVAAIVDKAIHHLNLQYGEPAGMPLLNKKVIESVVRQVLAQKQHADLMSRFNDLPVDALVLMLQHLTGGNAKPRLISAADPVEAVGGDVELGLVAAGGAKKPKKIK